MKMTKTTGKRHLLLLPHGEEKEKNMHHNHSDDKIRGQSNVGVDRAKFHGKQSLRGRYLVTEQSQFSDEDLSANDVY